MTRFFVAGRPAPQGSKSISRTGHLYETSRHLKPWRATVALAARAQRPTVIEGPVVLGMEFIMLRPKATPKTRPTPPAVRRPDIEKLARAVSDALTGVFFGDDAQVTVMPLAKRVAEAGELPGVKIFVAPCDPAAVAEVLAQMYAAPVCSCYTTCLE
ncbi:RusA family crossover junction endodeoxyribonuclease [Nocardia brasiliensis]|uniref:RusA family crossover junction endodeoxyribonuclease n=1 Tax=Nocardia brasiliensis TaxID=37326 RepID=UPI002453D9AD|nr:RusA family crossover junction endodeoxyribonuclease [Nocardia brasiliensis]